MSVPITKFICCALIAIAGLIVVKNISGSKEKLLSIKSIALMILEHYIWHVMLKAIQSK